MFGNKFLNQDTAVEIIQKIALNQRVREKLLIKLKR